MTTCKDLMIKYGKIDKKKIITFDPETTHHLSKQNWEKVAKLMKDPDSLDVVVTWAGGNRSHNYFPSCLPVAMFKFEYKNELHQLAGRSERTDKGEEFIVACVENENTEKEAAKVKEEEAKEEAVERPVHPAPVLLEQEDEEMDEIDDNQIKNKKTCLLYTSPSTRDS